VPKPVIAAARKHLATLESARSSKPQSNAQTTDTNDNPPVPQQFGLFDLPPAAITALRDIDPDVLTPREALEALYRLKTLL